MTTYSVTVIGLGAMGGGMARAVLRSNVSQVVIGYDRVLTLKEEFHKEAQAVQKAPPAIPTTLSDAITSMEESSSAVHAVLLVLVNEKQCQEVCFGDGENLLSLLSKANSKKRIVILNSTVTGTCAFLESE